MPINNNEIFSTLKEHYLNVSNKEIPLKLRMGYARKVPEDLVKYFVNQKDIISHLEQKNTERKEKNKEKAQAKEKRLKIYYDNIPDYISFLTDFYYIPKKYCTDLMYIHKTGNVYLHSNDGNDKSYHRIKGAISEIVEWFFNKNKVDTSFLASKGHTTKRHPKRKSILLFTIVGMLLVISIFFFYKPDKTQQINQDNKTLEEYVTKENDIKEDLNNIDVSNTDKTTSPTVNEIPRSNQENSEMKVIINNQDGGKIDNIININEAKDVNL